MTEVEFQTGINKLSAAFGDRNISAERSLVIFEYVGEFTAATWTRVVDRVIRECQYVPPIQKFLEFAREFEKRQKGEQDPHDEERSRLATLMAARSTDTKPGPCWRCDSSGVFEAETTIGANRYCFLCECPAGEIAAQLPENRRLRPWPPPNARDFIPPEPIGRPTRNVYALDESESAPRLADKIADRLRLPSSPKGAP